MPQPQQRGGKKPLAVLIAASFVVAAPVIQKWEGKRNEPYYDVVRVLTVCYGSTRNIERRRYSDAECLALLEVDYRRHAEEVARCTPEIVENPYVFGATASLTYNIGARAYCRSTAAKHFKTGNFRAGCEAQSKFIYAGKRIYAGLVKRRRDELKLCLKGLGE